MKVELKPCCDHRGREFDQWWLHVDGQRWGIVSKRNKGHVALTHRVTPQQAAEVKAQVEKLVGERSSVSMPPEGFDEAEEQDDDDDA